MYHSQLEHWKIAGKSVDAHVKMSITSPFFNRMTFHLAVRCKTFHQINTLNFKLKFQAIAEKTAKKLYWGHYILLHSVDTHHFDQLI